MFKEFKKDFQKHFEEFIKGGEKLYLTNVDKDVLWETYLNSYTEEERQGHNCNSCRQFIKNYGNLVKFKDNKLETIWFFSTTGEYQVVAKNLHRLVAGSSVRDVFVTDTAKLGTDSNVQLLNPPVDGQSTRTWNHLFFQLPKSYVTTSSASRETIQGTARTTKEVFKRSLDEITKDSIETVLDLISQNSLYRGAEYEASLKKFLTIKKEYDKLKSFEKDNFCWSNSGTTGESVARIRNTAIGTLLVNVSAGMELDAAVGKFEAIMAPSNYKRPNAVITKKMVENAEKVIAELGYTDSLGRKFAAPEDVNVNNVLFVNRDAKKGTGIFDQLKDNVAVNPKSLSKVEEVSAQDFITKILPKASGIEVLVENKHQGNFVSLIGPKDPSAPTLFKWDNPFSWSYKDSLADSMKEKVKAAGGKVDGVLRFSLQWNDNGDSICDLDAHAFEPGAHIYYGSPYRKDQGNRRTPLSGQLDVDMIRPSGTGIENIAWSDQSKMKPGPYVFSVNNFDGGHNTGFQAEIEFNGEIHTFAYGKKLTGSIQVAEVTYKGGEFSIKPLIESSNAVSSKKIWGIDTNRFHKVSIVMKSPNYWCDCHVGNEHLFFMVEGAENDESVRGVFNEFIKDDLLRDHKRVFEALGSKMKVEPSHKQLSGLGFSSTNKSDVIVKVDGSFTRSLKIVF